MGTTPLGRIQKLGPLHQLSSPTGHCLLPANSHDLCVFQDALSSAQGADPIMSKFTEMISPPFPPFTSFPETYGNSRQILRVGSLNTQLVHALLIVFLCLLLRSGFGDNIFLCALLHLWLVFPAYCLLPTRDHESGAPSHSGEGHLALQRNPSSHSCLTGSRLV